MAQENVGGNRGAVGILGVLVPLPRRGDLGSAQSRDIPIDTWMQGWAQPLPTPKQPALHGRGDSGERIPVGSIIHSVLGSNYPP